MVNARISKRAECLASTSMLVYGFTECHPYLRYCARALDFEPNFEPIWLSLFLSQQVVKPCYELVDASKDLVEVVIYHHHFVNILWVKVYVG